RLSSRIIANSHVTARRFGLPLRERVKVVHNGLDLRWLSANQTVKPALIEPGWKVILVVARLSKWKRHDLVISAFERVAESAPELHLICIGAKDPLDEDWWVELQGRTRRSAFSNRIHWVGHVADVRPWYRAASMLVLPSQNEPFGRVLVEAMACGVPVIATQGGGVPEIVRHGKDGLLVGLGQADEMAKAILRVLRDDVLRADLTESARTRAKLFSLEAHIARMEQIFEETLKK
ncbi:MAG: glycosyltransferase family 4 protein, partial [Desulfobacterales bacterium]|nr:glycosyltransferase family 4 protein [Desulfobacterales bacterium]